MKTLPITFYKEERYYEIKKLTSFALASLMVAGTLTSCGSEEAAPEATTGGEETAAESTETGSVYFLNFKPESADIWTEIATTYTAETGVPVKVQTAAANTYEQTLKSEIAKSEPPTLFQINGPIGYKSWADYCLDLSGTDLYANLLDKGMAVSTDEGVFGIPYVVEGYGIIYNDAIMQKYFALDGAKATSMEEINNFATLKAVVEDMQARKADLGIDGVFSSTSFAAGEDWRWQTHLANLPVYYEYKDDNVGDKAELEFRYSDNYKNIFDLYLNNSVIEPSRVI